MSAIISQGACWRAVAMATVAAFAGCKAPPQDRFVLPQEAKARGLALIKSTGCGACHAIPGVAWPKGTLAPSLSDYGDTGLIAGAVPNTPGNLARFIRDAPSVKPGAAMPPMPLTAAQAADIAAYLYGAPHD